VENVLNVDIIDVIPHWNFIIEIR